MPGTRGGGAFHNFAVFALARRVNNPTIEANVAGKPVDLLLPAAGNDGFLNAVREQVPDACIPGNAMIGMEVKRSFAATGEHNLQANLDVGLFVILGVQQHDLDRAQASINLLPLPEQERALAVDVLDLIQSLERPHAK